MRDGCADVEQPPPPSVAVPWSRPEQRHTKGRGSCAPLPMERHEMSNGCADVKQPPPSSVAVPSSRSEQRHTEGRGPCAPPHGEETECAADAQMWNNPHRLPSPSLRRGPNNGTRRGVGRAPLPMERRQNERRMRRCGITPTAFRRRPFVEARATAHEGARVVRRVTTPRPLFAGCPARVIGHAQCLRRGCGRSWHVASERIASARRAQRSTALVGARAALVGGHARCLAPRSSLEAPSSTSRLAVGERGKACQSTQPHLHEGDGFCSSPSPWRRR